MKKQLLAALLLLVPTVALGQCPPLCGPDYDVPIHFTIPSISIQEGGYGAFQVDVEAYETKIGIIFIVKDTPQYSVVGLQKGSGMTTCWDNSYPGFGIDYNYNGPGEHRIQLWNWCSDPCTDEWKGDYYFYLNLPGYQAIFRDIFRIVVYGEQGGTALLDLNDCHDYNHGEEFATSWVNHFPQMTCLTSASRAGLVDPNNACGSGPYKNTYSTMDFVPAVTADEFSNSTVTVQTGGGQGPPCKGCGLEKGSPDLDTVFPNTQWRPGYGPPTTTAVEQTTWEQVKRLYR